MAKMVDYANEFQSYTFVPPDRECRICGFKWRESTKYNWGLSHDNYHAAHLAALAKNIHERLIMPKQSIWSKG